MLCILVSLKGMIRVWGRKLISDYLFLRKYDNTPFPKKNKLFKRCSQYLRSRE